MKQILNFIHLVVRLYIVFKVGFLLYMTMTNPEEYPLDKMTWWIYFLVFDIWLMKIVDDRIKENQSEN